jgi:hypothetical protein
MKTRKFTTNLIILGSCFTGWLGCSRSDDANFKVIGGETPPLNHISHSNTVGLSLNDGTLGQDSSPQCSGFILSSGWVVTAAHCMDLGTMKYVYFRNDQLGASPVWREIDQVISHPEWNHEGLFDISLVHFKSQPSDLSGMPLGFSGIDILRESDLPNLKSSKEMDIAGYGVSQFPGTEASFEKLHAWVSIDRFWSDFFMAPGLITYSDPEFQGACYGDSGGPAYVELDGRPHVIGITQGARGRYFNQKTKLECNEGKGVYTFLSPFRDWIYGTIKSETPPSYNWSLEAPDFSSLRDFCRASKSKNIWSSFFSLALLLEAKTDIPMFGCEELERAAASVKILELSPWATYQPVEALLAHMSHLKEVVIKDPNGSLVAPVDLGSFLSAEGLTKLIVDGPSLASTRELRYLNSLSYLDLFGSSEPDISDLRGLKNLEFLSIAGLAASQLAEIGSFSLLKTYVARRCILGTEAIQDLFTEGTFKSLKLADFSRCAVDYQELYNNRQKLQKFSPGTVLKFQRSYAPENADLLSQITKNDFGVVVTFQ